MNTAATPNTGTRIATPAPHVGRVVWALLAAVLAFIVWAAWADLDQITRGSGQVIASSHTQVVQTVDGGILATLRVREGDKVRRGQLLATLEAAKAEASFQETAARTAACRLVYRVR